MNSQRSIRTLVGIWLGWALVLVAFQHWVGVRLQLKRPDFVLTWTANETAANSQRDKPYLNDPFMNEHVSWDSEFYLSVATVGYDDPAVRAIPSNFSWEVEPYCIAGSDPDCHSLNYAFFPVYPAATRLVSLPLRLLNLTPIARSTLAGVVVSLLGTLGAVLALYSMARGSLGEDGAVRAAFYLLVFPSGFFLAQVYTEGLAIGLAFGSLAFLLARRWGWSALLAALAVGTRPGMALLLLPMAIVWYRDQPWRNGWRSALSRGLAALAPAFAYGAWASTRLADHFFLLERLYFGRKLLAIGPSLKLWAEAVQSLGEAGLPTAVYYGLELAAIALAVAACVLLWKERPELSAFGLAVLAFTFASNSPQGMLRYVLPVAPLFWVLARWGGRPLFDRLWTLASALLLGMQAMLFSFDFWVA
jgi:hypothetical protein